uniref:XK-related protein n=1 Tax=Knipowitschia caucasica TaxID=637954 RepID=A0AAV2J2Q1_KNICA
MAVFRFSRLDVGLTVLGLGALVLDIVLDVRTAVELYQEGDILRLSVLLLLLVSSSLLVQSYSWLWYSYDGFHRDTRVEQALSLRTLRILHCLQLGTYLRHLGVLELAVGHVFCGTDQRDLSVFLSHDVAMLRLVEAFSESLPQLVLMLSTSIHRGELHLWPGLKAAASALCVSFTVLSYHRSLRSFLPDKQKQSVLSSLVFLVWNLLLLVSRVSALSLVMSSWPCLSLVHVLCSWLVLSGCAWFCRTAFMSSPGGELLYRGTVGLIWYFTWFNVVEGKTFLRTALYHVYQLLDISLLCSVWVWTRELQTQDLLLSLAVLVTYNVGLMVKGLYYRCLHPNLRVQDQVDSGHSNTCVSLDGAKHSCRSEVSFKVHHRRT